MGTEDQTALRPVFIKSSSGRLFGIHHARANNSVAPRRAIIYVPPFAEEMNRSRRMAALQARAFAASGIDTVLLDLFGTGDSDGDFRDARLSLWLDDIIAAADWLEAQSGATPCLWGLRLGALLACAVAANHPERFKQLLLWQPVLDGKGMLTQFLRIRVAAAMADGGGVERTDELRAQLVAGGSVEVAGYELSGELAQALDGLRLDRVNLVADTRVVWFDVGAQPKSQVSPAGTGVADAWRKAGIDLSIATVVGDPFWALQETTLAPELLAATLGACRS